MRIWQFLVLCALVYVGALNPRLGIATFYEPAKGAAISFDRLAEANVGTQHPGVIRPAPRRVEITND